MENHDSMAKGSVRGTMKETLDIFLNFKQNDHPAVQALQLGFFTLIGMLILFAIGYFGIFSQFPDFMAKFGWLMIDLMIAIVMVSTSAWYWKAYQTVSCSTGMMVGMIQGMLTGFLIALIIGVSNGMFIGAVIGIIAGVALGAWVGKCCGVMGILEGEMAGFMAGPMGAMTSIMMLNDQYMLFIPIAIGFSAVFLANTALTGHQENLERDCCVAKRSIKEEYLLFLGLNFVAFLILAGIMLYGPKSALFSITLN